MMDKRRFPDTNISSHELKRERERVLQLTFNDRYLGSVVYIVRCFHQILIVLFTR